MTDRHELIFLLKKWNIDYNILTNNFTGNQQVTITVPVVEKRTTVWGYSGFETTFEFDATGNFVNMGIWE